MARTLVLFLGVAAEVHASEVEPYIVVATQRTGSAWIMKTLHKKMCDIHAEPEIYLDSAGSGRWCEVDGPLGVPAKKLERGGCTRKLLLQLNSLQALYDPEATVDPRLLNDTTYHKWHGLYDVARERRRPFAYGFKWMLNQGFHELWPLVLELAANHGIKLVFLHRRDYVKMLISRAHERAFTAHPDEAGAAEIRTAPVHLPTGPDLLEKLDALQLQFQFMDAYQAAAQARGVDTFKVVYEDVAADNERYFRKMWRFLTRSLDRSASSCDASAMPLLGGVGVHIHPDPASTYVRNWDAVARTLNGTAYAAFAAEGRRSS